MPIRRVWKSSPGLKGVGCYLLFGRNFPDCVIQSEQWNRNFSWEQPFCVLPPEPSQAVHPNEGVREWAGTGGKKRGVRVIQDVEALDQRTGQSATEVRNEVQRGGLFSGLDLKFKSQERLLAVDGCYADVAYSSGV